MPNKTTTTRHKSRDLTSSIRHTSSSQPHQNISQESAGGAGSGDDLTRAQEQPRSLFSSAKRSTTPDRRLGADQTYDHPGNGDHVYMSRFEIAFDFLAFALVGARTGALDISLRAIFLVEHHHVDTGQMAEIRPCKNE